MDNNNQLELESALYWLASDLNRTGDNGIRTIKKSLLSDHLSFGYKDIDTGFGKIYTISWNQIKQRLNQWESNGWIKQVMDPESASENDVCLILLKYIGGGPWNGGDDLPE